LGVAFNTGIPFDLVGKTRGDFIKDSFGIDEDKLNEIVTTHEQKIGGGVDDVFSYNDSQDGQQMEDFRRALEHVLEDNKCNLGDMKIQEDIESSESDEGKSPLQSIIRIIPNFMHLYIHYRSKQ
jgi:hypothetical protein